MEEKEVPGSGFQVVRIYTLKQSYEILDPDQEEVAEPGERPFEFWWDWRRVEESEEDDEKPIEVRLRIQVGPAEDSPERAEVDLIGRFVLYGERNLSVRDFVMGPATAILMPYVREKLSVLTGGGPYGGYHLPVVNVQKLMDSMDFEKSTGFAQGAGEGDVEGDVGANGEEPPSVDQ